MTSILASGHVRDGAADIEFGGHHIASLADLGFVAAVTDADGGSWLVGDLHRFALGLHEVESTASLS